jgi:probable rRNA maturation factor
MEVTAETDVPPRSWQELVRAAEHLAANIIPNRRACLRVTDAASIRALNREFRSIDRPTDVLSFPSGETGPTAHAGDIALSWDAAATQARTHGHSPEAEACALTAHALLHLAGWDHRDDAEQARMDARTLELCRGAGYEVNGFGH